MSSDPHRHSVTAIIVAHDGSRWLPETLEALRSQTRQPDRVVAVDNDSRDRSFSMLVEEFGAERVLQLPRDTGFGAAVGKALQHPAAGSPTNALEVAGSGGAEWIWLLHDDCAPAPDALERLLEAADENRYAAVLGPKLRDWLDRRVLLEAGVTIDGSGRRETGLERREFDQGQHDGVHEVLAVSTAGMLARCDVWDALGGLAAELPLFRDDVDFGWRVNASGHRVLAVTDARAYHAEAAARRHRRITAAAAEHPRRLDRRNAVFVLLANLPGKLAAWAAVRNLFGGIVRTLVFLLAKQPAHAWDEVIAYTSVVGYPGRLRSARKRRSRGPKRSYRTLRKLMPPRWQGLRRLGDMVARFATGTRGPVEAGRHHAADLGPIVEEDDPLAPQSGLMARLLREPGVLLFLALAAVSLVAQRELLLGGRLGGGALLPVSGDAGDLWGEYLSGWHAVGLGNAVPAPPYVAVIALLATLLAGKTGLAMGVLLLGCVPLAGASAYGASRWVVQDVRIRLWAAASYALLPVATGTVAAGRFGTAAAFVLLPLIGLLVGRMLRLGPRKATRAAWGAGGLLAVATAFAPLTWILALASTSVAHRAWKKTQGGLFARMAIVLVVPLVLLLPWTMRIFLHPGLFLREAGLTVPETVEPLGPLSVLMLQPGGPGMPPLWVAAGLVTAALAALARRDRRAVVLGGWLLGLVGMATGVLVSRMRVTPPGEEAAAGGWPGVCLAVAGLGLILAAAVSIEGALGRFSEREERLSGLAERPDDVAEPAEPKGSLRKRVVNPLRARTRGRGAVRSSVRSSVRGRGTSRGRLGLRGLFGLRGRLGFGSRLGVMRIPKLPLPRWRRWAAVGLAVAACSAPVAASAVWIYSGVTGPLDRANPPVLPAFLAAKSDSPTHPRTLVLRSDGDGQVSYTVLRDRAPLLGYSEMPAPPGVTDRVASVVAGLASGRRSGEVVELAKRGIQYVVMPGPLASDLVATLDANPNLSQISRLPDLAVWRLDPTAARLRVESDSGVEPLPSGRVDAVADLPAGPGGRTLVLAETADPGWQATLNGRELSPSGVRGWAQGFELPPSGGQLVVTYSSARGLLVALQAFLVFVVFVLALPGGGQQTEDEAESTSSAPAVSRRERRRTRKAPQRARGHRANKPGSNRAASSSRDTPAVPDASPEPEPAAGRARSGRGRAR